MRLTRLLVTAGMWTVAARGVPAQEQTATQMAGMAAPQFTAVTDAMLRTARDDGGKNWLMYGRDYTDQRWSPLVQITPANVTNLRVAGCIRPASRGWARSRPPRSSSTAIMYVTTPYDVAMAVDARTGRELWRYEHKLGTTIFCCGPNNRGVAVSGGTPSSWSPSTRISVALDAQTGKVKWDIQVEDPAAGYSREPAPIVIGDKVLIGVGGGEYGIRGFVRAYNVKERASRSGPRTRVRGPVGRQVVRENVGGGFLPQPQHREGEGRPRPSSPMPGSGAAAVVWMNAAIDAASNQLFVASGNPSPDLYGGVRPGDDLCTDCILAIDINPGRSSGTTRKSRTMCGISTRRVRRSSSS